MRRTSVTLLVAIASLCIAATTSAVRADCKSVEALCAVEAGGRCDQQSGHWCYGRSRTGEWCGGTGAAFRKCMARHGVQVYGAQVPRAPGPAATGSDPGKCTSIQAQCAMEIGGTCDRNTGHWCYGTVFARNCGGNNNAGQFDRCVSRKLGERK